MEVSFCANMPNNTTVEKRLKTLEETQQRLEGSQNKHPHEQNTLKGKGVIDNGQV
jgi:hypothetical protein